LNTKSNTDPNPNPSTNSLFLLLAMLTFSKQTDSVSEKIHRSEKQLKTSRK